MQHTSPPDPASERYWQPRRVTPAGAAGIGAGAGSWRAAIVRAYGPTNALGKLGGYPVGGIGQSKPAAPGHRPGGDRHRA